MKEQMIMLREAKALKAVMEAAERFHHDIDTQEDTRPFTVAAVALTWTGEINDRDLYITKVPTLTIRFTPEGDAVVLCEGHSPE